jgi:hypothetical protein
MFILSCSYHVVSSATVKRQTSWNYCNLKSFHSTVEDDWASLFLIRLVAKGLSKVPFEQQKFYFAMEI